MIYTEYKILYILYSNKNIKSLMMALTEHCPSTWHMLIERLIIY